MNHEPLIDVSDDITAYITNEDGFDVAVLQRVLEKNPCGEPRLTDDEWQSLVNLVNAAPEMLTALKCALADLEGALQVHEQMDWYAHDWDSHQQSIDEARAAIDKATK
jgi:hypothetical protein